MIAACGGGQDDSRDGHAFASAMASTSPATRESSSGIAAAATAVAITDDQLFRFAQVAYPDLFPDSPPTVNVAYAGKTYRVRAYVNGNYIGLADGQVYGLGAFTGNALAQFGAVSSFEEQVCNRVGCSRTLPDAGSVISSVQVGSPAKVTFPAQARQNRPLSSTPITLSGTVTGDVNSLAGKTIYVIVEDPAEFFQTQPSLVLTPGSPWRYELKLYSKNIARAGRFAGSIRVFVCVDGQCAQRLGGTPVSLPYDVSVSAG